MIIKIELQEVMNYVICERQRIFDEMKKDIESVNTYTVALRRFGYANYIKALAELNFISPRLAEREKDILEKNLDWLLVSKSGGSGEKYNNLDWLLVSESGEPGEDH